MPTVSEVVSLKQASFQAVRRSIGDRDQHLVFVLPLCSDSQLARALHILHGIESVHDQTHHRYQVGGLKGIN